MARLNGHRQPDVRGFRAYLVAAFASAMPHYIEVDDSYAAQRAVWLEDLIDAGIDDFQLGEDQAREVLAQIEDQHEQERLEENERATALATGDALLKPQRPTQEREPLAPTAPRRPLLRSSEAVPSTAGMTLADLQESETRAPEDLLQGLLPAGAGLLIAPPKRKKSFLLLDLALAVAEGRESHLGRRLRAGAVIWLGLEQSGARLKERVALLLPRSPRWPENFFVYARDQLRLPDTELRLAWLRSIIEQHRPALVVIDGWSRFRAIPTGQSLYDADRDAIDPLCALADEFACTILAAHHAAKRGTGRDPSQDAVATHGLGGGASFLIGLVHDPRGVKGELVVSGNDVEFQRVPLAWDSNSSSWKLGEEAKIGRPSKREAVEAWLRTQLANGPRPAKALIQKALKENICVERTLRSVKVMMGIESAKKQWRLPS